MSIVNATDPIIDYSNVSSLLPPGTIEYTFTGVPTGRTYTVTVIAINGVGESLAANKTIGTFIINYNYYVFNWRSIMM